MKVSAKPISSPGRTDEFPPPLVRFLRSKSSRGSRSRSSPMFVGKINTVNETTQEPSSPKVTCIGQVRVRRSKDRQTAPRTTAVRRCRRARKLEPRRIRRVWRKLVSIFLCGYCRKSRKLRDSKQIETNQRNEYKKRETKDVIGADNEVSVSESPPRNAFVLTRCKSAPYRSSSLGSKIWESTMEKTGEDREDDETGKKVAEKVGIKEERQGINGNIGKENGEDEGSINGVEEFKARPLSLSRCKSQPARRGVKLFMSFSFIF